MTPSNDESLRTKLTSNRGRTCLTEDDVRLIRQAFMVGSKVEDLVERWKVSRATIYRALSGKYQTPVNLLRGELVGETQRAVIFLCRRCGQPERYIEKATGFEKCFGCYPSPSNEPG